MTRFSMLAVAALVIGLATVAIAQETKEKTAPPKEKAPPPAKDEKAAPASKEKEKEKEKPAITSELLKPSPYYPLAVGNAWNYKVGDNKYTMKVAKYEKVGDILCARVEMSVDGKVTSHEHISVTGDGVVRVAFDDKKAEPPVLFLKLPAAKDSSWKVDSVVGKVDKSPGETLKGTFKEGEEKVTVPAGSYDTVSVSTTDLDAAGMKLSFTYYFAKDVGMVKQIIEVAGQKVTIELEKFEPAKQ